MNVISTWMQTAKWSLKFNYILWYYGSGVWGIWNKIIFLTIVEFKSLQSRNIYHTIFGDYLVWFRFMVFNATFNDFSVISWWWLFESHLSECAWRKEYYRHSNVCFLPWPSPWNGQRNKGQLKYKVLRQTWRLQMTFQMKIDLLPFYVCFVSLLNTVDVL